MPQRGPKIHKNEVISSRVFCWSCERAVIEAPGPHFGGFWEAKWTLKCKGAKGANHEKPMFYYNKIQVFKASGHQNRQTNL